VTAKSVVATDVSESSSVVAGAAPSTASSSVVLVVDISTPMHGGMFFLHEPLLAWRWSAQQASLPPGLSLHPSPPHVPQEDGQQMELPLTDWSSPLLVADE